MKRVAGNAGFTLIEVMISVAVLSIVLVIAYGVFARTLSQKEHAEAASLESATARAVLRRILRDLESVEVGGATAPRRTPTPGRTGLPSASEQLLFLSTNRSQGGVPFDDLMFSATLRKPSAVTISTSDLAVIRYFVEPEPANPENLVLWRETAFSLSGEVIDPESPTPERSIRIADGLAGLELRFFDGRDWVEEWDSSDSRNYGPAPQAVEVALALRDADGEVEVYRTSIDLPAARRAAPAARAAGAPQTPAPDGGETPR